MTINADATDVLVAARRPLSNASKPMEIVIVTGRYREFSDSNHRETMWADMSGTVRENSC